MRYSAIIDKQGRYPTFGKTATVGIVATRTVRIT
jgi:hypothetical protein